MADYNIYLVKVGEAVPDKQKIAAALESLFNRVISESKNKTLQQRFEKAKVSWADVVPTVQAHELLVYVLASSSDSIVSTYFKTSAGSAGTTAWNDQVTGSEVFLRSYSAKAVANLIFHECLHNKGHWPDSVLHKEGGLAAETITETTALTQQNITRMAGALAGSRPQWTGGVNYFNDPLKL